MPSGKLSITFFPAVNGMDNRLMPFMSQMETVATVSLLTVRCPLLYILMAY